MCCPFTNVYSSPLVGCRRCAALDPSEPNCCRFSQPRTGLKGSECELHTGGNQWHRRCGCQATGQACAFEGTPALLRKGLQRIFARNKRGLSHLRVFQPSRGPRSAPAGAILCPIHCREGHAQSQECFRSYSGDAHGRGTGTEPVTLRGPLCE